MIKGVSIHPLRQIADARGKIMHMLRCDDPHFERFGEIYFSMVFPGMVKGWHVHQRMTLNYAVVVGQIRLVLYDDRDASPTRSQIQEIVLGADPEHYLLVQVPPWVWNGFLGVGQTPSLVANCATEPHDPQEIIRKDPRDPSIPYRWDARQPGAM